MPRAALLRDVPGVGVEAVEGRRLGQRHPVAVDDLGPCQHHRRRRRHRVDGARHEVRSGDHLPVAQPQHRRRAEEREDDQQRHHAQAAVRSAEHGRSGRREDDHVAQLPETQLAGLAPHLRGVRPGLDGEGLVAKQPRDLLAPVGQVGDLGAGGIGGQRLGQVDEARASWRPGWRPSAGRPAGGAGVAPATGARRRGHVPRSPGRGRRRRGVEHPGRQPSAGPGAAGQAAHAQAPPGAAGDPRPRPTPRFQPRGPSRSTASSSPRRVRRSFMRRP